MSESAATAQATARFPRHHALRYRTSLATPLATAVAVALAWYLLDPYHGVRTLSTGLTNHGARHSLPGKPLADHLGMLSRHLQS